VLTIKRKTARVLNVADVDRKEITILGPAKCAITPVGEAIFIAEVKDAATVDVAFAAAIGRSSMAVRITSYEGERKLAVALRLHGDVKDNAIGLGASVAGKLADEIRPRRRNQNSRL
jgi:hypothetical protein